MKWNSIVTLFIAVVGGGVYEHFHNLALSFSLAGMAAFLFIAIFFDAKVTQAIALAAGSVALAIALTMQNSAGIMLVGLVLFFVIPVAAGVVAAEEKESPVLCYLAVAPGIGVVFSWLVLALRRVVPRWRPREKDAVTQL